MKQEVQSIEEKMREDLVNILYEDNGTGSGADSVVEYMVKENEKLIDKTILEFSNWLIEKEAEVLNGSLWIQIGGNADNGYSKQFTPEQLLLIFKVQKNDRK